MSIYVILPAAGIGTRMASNKPKQYLLLAGIPVIIHTLRTFLSIPRITELVLAVQPAEIENVQALLNEHGLTSRIRIAPGGENRQQSVANGLAALTAASDDIVLVHDAVRPLIDADTINRTIDAVITHGAAIVGLPAIDTIKQVERTAHSTLITSTIPREYIVHAQTPQGFRYGLLRRSFDEAAADGFTGTDESSVVERAGHPVAVVLGSPRNFKVTQPGDLELAEFYLRQSR
jgi:2-C-methyl-D-erythritol 4-phosphate cytidylyltransferase